MLLVLDNCEHVLEDCGVLTDALLAACPGVRILATSRQPLGISNEAVRPVPPLSVPAADAEGLARHAAVRLFVERARLKLPAFELSPENARAIAQVCRKLEGIPLAIELAAARMDVLTVEQVAERLDRALGLLTGGRVAANRHRTLRAALDWSHELLSEPERELFGRLSVFAGGWTLEAAETAGAGDGVAEGEVLELFLGLVDKSLVVASPRKEGGFRYGMLEPVRQYAREKLEESGAEAEATQQRHAMWYLAFAEEAEEGWSGPEHAAWVRRLETEHDNLRAALRWAIDSGEAGLALRLSGALWQFWFEAGHSVEGRGWLEEALSVGGSPAEMAKALNGAGYLTTFQNDYQVAKTQLQEALRLYRQLGDEEGIASALAHLVFYALMGQRGDVDAPKLLGEALALRSRIKDRRTIANVLTLLLIGSIAGMVEEDLREVARLHEEALTGFREAGYVWGIFTCLTNVGLIRLALGELDRAGACFRELLPVSQEADDKVARHHALHGLACVAAAKGDSERAARLWGASEAMQESSGVRLPPITLSFTDYERRLAEARTRLGKTAFDRAWADGEVMTDEEATGYALAVEATAPAPVVSSEQPEVSKQSTAALTNREKEVAALIAHGLINRRIAEELHLSERTVTTHVRRILKKLGIRSREQVASRLSD